MEDIWFGVNLRINRYEILTWVEWLYSFSNFPVGLVVTACTYCHMLLSSVGIFGKLGVILCMIKVIFILQRFFMLLIHQWELSLKLYVGLHRPMELCCSVIECPVGTFLPCPIQKSMLMLVGQLGHALVLWGLSFGMLRVFLWLHEGMLFTLHQ